MTRVRHFGTVSFNKLLHMLLAERVKDDTNLLFIVGFVTVIYLKHTSGASDWLM
jgi:hypothetical protein